MPGWTRPVRMLLKSSFATETALSIFSSASRRVSSIMITAPVRTRECRSAHPGRPSPHYPAPRVSKTTMGSLLSRQRLIAVASMPRRASAAPRNMLPPPRRPARPGRALRRSPRPGAPRRRARCPATRCPRTRRRAVGGFPARPSGLADLEPGEATDGHAVALENLGHDPLRLLHERLLGEHDVLEEGANPALDDLGDRLLGLALLAGDLLRDPALPLGHVGRHLVAGDVLRTHRRDLLGQ